MVSGLCCGGRPLTRKMKGAFEVAMKGAVCRKGFTLIELLVVIAIIAILAAVMFPVFVKAKENAKAIKCLNNTTQVARAMQMYLQDWNDTLPSQNNWPGAPYAYSGVLAWQWDPVYAGVADLLNRYLKNKPVWRCPAAPNKFYTYHDFVTGGYEINVFIFNAACRRPYEPPGRPDLPPGPVKMSQIRRPSNTGFMYCGGIGTHGFGPWHNGGHNWSFMDGHAKWRKWTDDLNSWPYWWYL